MGRYLKKLIAEGENQKLDFKYCVSDSRKIARTLAAFANSQGGRILIGVRDNGSIAGIRSDEEYYMLESAASLHCKPEVKFTSRNHSIEGKSVLEIYIPPVDHKPVYARDEENRWKAYLRVADQNILAGIVQLQVWKEEKKSRGKLLEFTRREQILLGYLENSPDAGLSTIQRDTGFNRKELVNLITKLVLFDVVEMHLSNGKNIFHLKEAPGQ